MNDVHLVEVALEDIMSIEMDRPPEGWNTIECMLGAGLSKPRSL